MLHAMTSIFRGLFDVSRLVLQLLHVTPFLTPRACLSTTIKQVMDFWTLPQRMDAVTAAQYQDCNNYLHVVVCFWVMMFIQLATAKT